MPTRLLPKPYATQMSNSIAHTAPTKVRRRLCSRCRRCRCRCRRNLPPVMRVFVSGQLTIHVCPVCLVGLAVRDAFIAGAKSHSRCALIWSTLNEMYTHIIYMDTHARSSPTPPPCSRLGTRTVDGWRESASANFAARPKLWRPLSVSVAACCCASKRRDYARANRT